MTRTSSISLKRVVIELNADIECGKPDRATLEGAVSISRSADELSSRAADLMRCGIQADKRNIRYSTLSWNKRHARWQSVANKLIARHSAQARRWAKAERGGAATGEAQSRLGELRQGPLRGYGTTQASWNSISA